MIDKEELGGAQVHSGKAGSRIFVCDTGRGDFDEYPGTSEFLPSNNMETLQL